MAVDGDFRFCPRCATPLAWVSQREDGGDKLRLRCPACDWTHWNNPTPVLAGIVEYRGKILLARNAAWTGRKFALITGFMEAGETPVEGVEREVKEETSLDATATTLVGVYDFQRMNQVLIVYHVLTDPTGEVALSPELAEYQLQAPEDVLCWPSGTGYGLGDWLRSRGIEPTFVDWAARG